MQHCNYGSWQNTLCLSPVQLPTLLQRESQQQRCLPPAYCRYLHVLPVSKLGGCESALIQEPSGLQCCTELIRLLSEMVSSLRQNIYSSLAVPPCTRQERGGQMSIRIPCNKPCLPFLTPPRRTMSCKAVTESSLQRVCFSICVRTENAQPQLLV